MVKAGEYEVPKDLYQSVDFAWIKVEGEKARIGITDYAQKQLREIVFAELPEVGTNLNQNGPYGTLESVKAVSDLISPLSGEILEVNEEVKSNPEILNEDPFEGGWLIVLKPSNLDEELVTLMDFEKSFEWHKNQ